MKILTIPPAVTRFIAKNWKYLLELILAYAIPAIFRKKKKDTGATLNSGLHDREPEKTELSPKFSAAAKSREKKWQRNYSKRLHKKKMPDHAFRIVMKHEKSTKQIFNPYTYIL
jgi:hypothetical protein